MSIEQGGNYGFGFNRQERDPKLSELSKRLSQNLLRANEMCRKAFFSILNHRIPSAQFGEFAREYNQLAKRYNHLRQELMSGSGFGLSLGNIEKLGDIAAKLQSIFDQTRVFARRQVIDRPINKEPEQTEPKKISPARVALYGASAITMLAATACSAAEVITVDNSIPNDAAVASEATVGSETEPGLSIDPTAAIETQEIKPTPTVSINIEGLPSDLNEFEAQEVTDIAQNWADVIQEGIDKNQSLREAMGNQIVVINPANFSIDEKTGSTVYLTQEGGPLGDAEMAIGKNNELVVGTFGGATAITGITVSKETHYWDHWKKNSTGEQVLLIRDKTTGEIVLATENYQWKKASEVSFIDEIDRSFIETGKNAIDASREDIEVAWEEMSYEQKLKYIETNPFAEEFGEGVSIGVVSPDGETITFNDGSKQIELSALWGYDDDAISFGETYSLEEQELKNILNSEEYLGRIERDINRGDKVSYVQFYPNLNEWEEPDKNLENGDDKYSMTFLGGTFILKSETGSIYVVEGKINLYKNYFLCGENSSGNISASASARENKKISAGLIGITTRNDFTPETNGLSRLYFEGVSAEFAEKELLGLEDLNNIKDFVQKLQDGRTPVVTEYMQLGTIDQNN